MELVLLGFDLGLMSRLKAKLKSSGLQMRKLLCVHMCQFSFKRGIHTLYIAIYSLLYIFTCMYMCKLYLDHMSGHELAP